MVGMVLDVNDRTFERDVVQRSYRVPVVVDFWAPWCGPCRMLGPVLEGLAHEFGGRFVLAKVNVDENPGLAGRFGVQGIPAVKAFRDGRVVDAFVGAQPEPMVRRFVERLTAVSPARAHSSAATTTSHITDPAIRLQKARQLLQQGKGCEAVSWLQGFPQGSGQGEARKLLALARLMCEGARQPATGDSNLDQLYQQAAEAARRREFSAVLYYLLAILRQNKQYRQGEAQQVVEGVFTLLGADDPLVRTYRQQLPI
ncbi:MAG: co-chaperone YbbN [Chloroflexi bacterium]|nr:MAG: co-chaperone YbbN [Chloroflexota bacterium]